MWLCDCTTILSSSTDVNNLRSEKGDFFNLHIYPPPLPDQHNITPHTLKDPEYAAAWHNAAA